MAVATAPGAGHRARRRGAARPPRPTSGRAPPPTSRAGSAGWARSWSPPGQAWPDWMIAAELAVHLDADLGLDSVGDVWDEIERLAPAYRGITRAVLDAAGRRRRRGGPAVGQRRSALGRRRLAAPLDPIAVPGVESVERQGAPPRAGLAESPTAGTAAARRDRRPHAAGSGDGAGPARRRWSRTGRARRAPRRPDRQLLAAAGGRPRVLYDQGAAVAVGPGAGRPGGRRPAAGQPARPRRPRAWPPGARSGSARPRPRPWSDRGARRRPCPARWWPPTSTSRWTRGRSPTSSTPPLPVVELRMETP